MEYRCISELRGRPELARLFDLSRPPTCLYISGSYNAALFERCVAVIGSRRLTEYGKRVIENIIPRLVFEKKTIVSGFMYGADQYAHQVCVASGGVTIAVLGWGIKRPLSPEDKKLAHAICGSGGLIISEWEEQEATLWTFPVRNRIVAAISQEVIVVEAAIKSGSLITASIAKKLHRTVWAVPGEITSRLSAGTNMLIASGDARMWFGDPAVTLPQTKDPILRLLQNESLTANELALSLKKPVSDIGAQLSFLSLTGQIVERGGKYSYVSKN